MIDLHSHILPGVDDGATDLPAAVAMARAAVADGIEVVAATPHVRADYPTSAAQMEALVGELQATLSAESVPLVLLTGGEIALDRLPELEDEELRRLGLGGNASALLLEFPYHGWPLGLEEMLFGLSVRGFRTVLAHPERNADIQARPERLSGVVAAGTLVQLTAASIDGRLGRSSRETAFRLLDLGLAHLLGSDAHAPSIRQIGMRAAAEAVGGRLARWLTLDVPRALIDGASPPERPSSPRRSRRLPWRRR